MATPLFVVALLTSRCADEAPSRDTHGVFTAKLGRLSDEETPDEKCGRVVVGVPNLLLLTLL